MIDKDCCICLGSGLIFSYLVSVNGLVRHYVSRCPCNTRSNGYKYDELDKAIDYWNAYEAKKGDDLDRVIYGRNIYEVKRGYE